MPAAGDPADLTPPGGLSAVGHLGVAGDRLVLTTAAGSGIELFRLTDGKPTPVTKRAVKPPHAFRGPAAVSPDGKRAACGCGTVAGLPAVGQ
jgi:hypothetical protein